MKSFIILLMFSFLDSADSLCPKGGYGNSQPQFGPGCMYRCHCLDDAQCDNITGNCPRRCAAGWMGPGCQYGDIAYNKTVQQLLYGNNSLMNGSNATDGLPSTCIGPTAWVVIDLNATYRISGLVITWSDAVNFAGYEVKVGNYSSNPPSDSIHTCFKQTVTHQLVISTDVVCTTEIVGRHLLIRTPDNATTMTLCDVRVYGGRSLAYRHNGSQSSTLSSFSYTAASGALDGNNDTSFWSKSCTHTEDEMSPWWKVNLAVVYNIERIVLYGRSDPCCTGWLSGFSESFATNSSFNLVFNYPETTPPLITEVILLTENYAQQVQITLKNTKPVALSLCEVFIFGDCQDDVCGWTCDIFCHCKGPIARQNIIDANCSGCKTGWWGHSCNITCHSNCIGNACNQAVGYCLNCSTGKWGNFCDKNCINCLQGTGFDTSAGNGSCYQDTGTCIHGCQPGWQEENCTIACPLGWYGKNCSNICGYCANTTCDHIDGKCPFGCTEEYNGTMCNEGCPVGWYGKNCSATCGHCANTTCDHINGTCPFGCSEGYSGTRCYERCPVGWYGTNCSATCGHCANTTCDHINGTCPFGCSQGYNGGTRCNERCPVGWYGKNCSNICGYCANTTCDHIDGTCPFGCTEGYNGGTRCNERLALEKSTDGSEFSPQTIGIIVGVFMCALLIGIAVGYFMKRSRMRRSASASAANARPENTYDQLDRDKVQNNSPSEYEKIQMETRMKH